MEKSAKTLIFAVPKGRLARPVRDLLAEIGLHAESSFDDSSARQLFFATNEPGVKLIRVRAADIPEFVAWGAAHMGVSGLDTLLESDNARVFAPLDLRIGVCRLVLAGSDKYGFENRSSFHSGAENLVIATKYPRITVRHFAARRINVECINLHGALELAPLTGLSRHIVDLVETGSTLRQNGLVEYETIAQISARLIVSRQALRAGHALLRNYLGNFDSLLGAQAPMGLGKKGSAEKDSA